jgi:beta-mannosidase
MAPSLRTCRDLLPTHNHISCRVLLALLAGLCMNSVHGADKPARRQITLRDGWLVKQLDTNKGDVAELSRESATPDKTWLPTRMPAQVHDVLLAHGVIPDPHIGKNAAASAWVGEKDWAYVCRFPTPENIHGQVFLRFEGLDTLTDTWLNGAPLGHFENMFREYAVEVKDHLAPAGKSNVLVIVFSSPLRYTRAAELPPGDPAAAPHKSLRKCHSDFSSYLGARPHAVKVGVYRDVVLDLPEQSWIQDVWVRSTLSPNRRAATLHVRVKTGGDQAAIHWLLTDPAGREVRHGESGASGAESELEISVSEPELWWPRMSGPQNLYTLDVRLMAGERVLDRQRTRFGIREVKPVLTDPATGEHRFRFDVNGQPIFMRGGNWVPLEGATHVWQPDRARQLLDLAEHGNMNMLRIWGEGVLPPPSFYEECDRRGICLWQDFMFGYYDHAKGDTVFLENCRAEIEGTIRRLRNHPSVMLWCGGNEQYLWTPTATVSEAKREIFERIMPEVCRRLDPTRLFHTSSPCGGSPTGNWPLEGDWHDYTTINFTPEASVPLFGSEVLRASVPSLASMKRFLSEEELWPKGFDPAIRKPGQPAWPPAWSYHSTGIGTWDRVGAVHEYCDPATAGELIRVIGAAHGEYLRDRLERERRGIPDGGPADVLQAVNRRCWGNLVWRLNDSWPMIYGSMVDYYLEPKIAHYFLRRAYEPVLVSFEKTPDRINVWVVNDSPETVAGTLVVQRMDFAGKALGSVRAEVSVKPGEARRGLNTTALGEISLRGQFLHAAFAGHEATHLLTAERYLHLPQAHLTARVVKGHIEIATNAFARQVTLEFDDVTGAVFADNFFDLIPGGKRTIAILKAACGSMLTIRALNADPVRLAWKP